MDLGPLTIFQLRPMQEWLVGYGTDGEFEPMLAESWSVEPDGFSLRFQLRKGVQFHNDAGEFTAQDVVHSFEQITREDSIHPHARIHRRGILEVVGDHEVVFRLPRGNAEYTNQLSRQSGSMAITSKVDFDSLGGEIDLGKRPVASTADVIARRLYEAGCRHAFGIPGGEVLRLVKGLTDNGISFGLAKHENAAGFMAEGTYHASGAPGVLVATLGPGVANAVNVVANATRIACRSCS